MKACWVMLHRRAICWDGCSLDDMHSNWKFCWGFGAGKHNPQIGSWANSETEVSHRVQAPRAFCSSTHVEENASREGCFLLMSLPSHSGFVYADGCCFFNDFMSVLASTWKNDTICVILVWITEGNCGKWRLKMVLNSCAGSTISPNWVWGAWSTVWFHQWNHQQCCCQSCSKGSPSFFSPVSCQMLNNDLETLLFVRSATEEISLLQCLLILFLCNVLLIFLSCGFLDAPIPPYCLGIAWQMLAKVLCFF